MKLAAKGIPVILILFVMAIAVHAQPVAQSVDINQHFCARGPGTELCSVLPFDVSGFTASKVYTLIEKNAQSPFDLFSWQTFVGLNWPSDDAGKPLPVGLNSHAMAPRVWQSWPRVNALFGNESSGACGANNTNPGALVFTEYLQAGGLPLVDQNSNYVVFDARVNKVMADYIVDNDLTSIRGQKIFAESGQEISFPKGFYRQPDLKTGGSAGAMVIKTAWRVLDKAEPKLLQRFFTVNGRIEIAATDTIDGTPLCLDATLALVGMHIVHRTESANGEHWIWSTFEHEDNAPYAANARGPNSIFAKQLFADGCQVNAETEKSYSFYNPRCPDCRINGLEQSAPGGWKWAGEAPFARVDVKHPVAPSQVVRCWKPSIGTDEINGVWQQKLEGMAWRHYRLSTTQWRGAPVGAMFPHGEVPRYLTNSTMETYIQDQVQGTCLGCHSAAVTKAGQSANGSFVFLRTPDSSKEN